MSIQEKIINEMISKLGISQNSHLTRKSIEIQELLRIKSSEMLGQLNENARIILCLEISCELLNLPFAETNQKVEAAGMKKSLYNKNKKVILKLLDLNKKMTIDEVMRKLNITHSSAVESCAKNLFKMYVKQQSFENQDLDSSIFVMCVFFACKFENVKVPKKSFLSLSNLTQSQWCVMEKSWDKWTRDLNLNRKESKKASDDNVKENIKNIDDHDDDIDANLKSSKTETSEESYDVWAKRILKKAFEQLGRNK